MTNHYEKKEALAIIQRLEQKIDTLEELTENPRAEKSGRVAAIAGKVLGFAAGRFSGAAPKRAAQNVRELKIQFPELSTDELIEKMIKAKCRKTAAIGATTSAASIVPGLGTAFSLTVGLVVDVGTTLRLHSELVLEIAEVRGHSLTEAERHKVLMTVMGFSTGMDQLSGRAIKGFTHKAGDLAARKWLAKALPAMGIAASASTNVLSTYIIGKRANAYFERGPEAMGDLKENLRALSGVDERKIAQWISEGSHGVARTSGSAGKYLVKGGKKGVRSVVDAGRKAGEVFAGAAGRTIGLVTRKKERQGSTHENDGEDTLP